MISEAESVPGAAATHSADVDAAIARSSRAVAEAREQAERFRERTATAAPEDAAVRPGGAGTGISQERTGF